MHKNSELKNLYNVAMNLLAIREHSRYQLMVKLQKHCADLTMVTQVINDLIQEDKLSDTRFIEALIYSKKNRGYGPNYIQQKLLAAGIDRNLILQALAKETDWELCAQKAYEKKYKNTITKNFVEKIKRKYYLQQRGFLISQILALQIFS